MNPIAREPVLIAALASVVTWLLAKYGINLSPQQASEISGVVLAVTVGFARQAVTPTAKTPTVQGNTSNSGAQVSFYPTAEGEVVTPQVPPVAPMK